MCIPACDAAMSQHSVAGALRVPQKWPSQVCVHDLDVISIETVARCQKHCYRKETVCKCLLDNTHIGYTLNCPHTCSTIIRV